MKNNKGFSLVELIVVIAIMAVLVGVLAPTLLRYVEKSRKQKDESAIGEVINAVTIALADETVATSITANTTVVVANGSITGGTDALRAEVTASVPAASVKLTSNAHKAQQYSIIITYSTTGLTVAPYADGNWSAVAPAPTT